MPSLADLIRQQIPHLKPIGRNPKSLLRAQSDVPPTTKSVHKIAQQIQDHIPLRHDRAPCLPLSNVSKTKGLDAARQADCDASDATLATAGTTTSDEDTVSSAVVVQTFVQELLRQVKDRLSKRNRISCSREGDQ
jgi:hypothetical protein